MAILRRSAWILAVIDMEYRNLVLADDLVEFFYHAVEIICHIIPGIVRVTRIKADTQLIIVSDAIINECQLLEASANLAALSCHCLKRDMHRRILGKHFI